MSTSHSKRSLSATIFATLMFVSAYLCASWLDLWTTDLALLEPGASEGNVFMVSEGDYRAARAWFVTFLMGIVLVAYFAFGMANAHRISDNWLRRPVLSFWNVWSNPIASLPWPRSVMDRWPLHAISLAVAFVVLRVLAALNNWLIVSTGEGPLSAAIRRASDYTSPLWAFVGVLWLTYAALILLVSVLVARLLSSRRRGFA